MSFRCKKCKEHGINPVRKVLESRMVEHFTVVQGDYGPVRTKTGEGPQIVSEGDFCAACAGQIVTKVNM